MRSPPRLGAARGRRSLRVDLGPVHQGCRNALLDRFLRCQVLGRGFAHMVCNDCGKPHLLVFCCRRRGFCPCCTGWRMAQCSTVPHALRPRVAYDRKLLPRVCGIFYDSIQRFYERRLADLGHAGGRTGSVTAIQRASSDLRLNPHLHGVFVDGVLTRVLRTRRQVGNPAAPWTSSTPLCRVTALFTERAGGELSFVDLPELSDLDVCEVLSTIVARVLGHLRRQGLLTRVLRTRRQVGNPAAPWTSSTPLCRVTTMLSDDGAELEAAEPEAEGDQLVLSALATAATFGKDLAGSERRPGRIPYAYEPGIEPRLQAPLCAAQAGFTLHASTHVEAGDRSGRERLIKYILRPALAAERLERVEGGRARLRLKRESSDGTWAIEMDELSLCARLAALVPPPPWQNGRTESGIRACCRRPANCVRASCRSHLPSRKRTMQVVTTRRRRCRQARSGPGRFRRGRAAGTGPADTRGGYSRRARSGSRPPPAPSAAASSDSGRWSRALTAFCAS